MLDDGTAAAASTDVSDELMQAMLAQKQAQREVEHAEALAAVSNSQQYVPSASRLSRNQLEQLRQPQAPYFAGAAGVIASKPPSTQAVREATDMRRRQREAAISPPPPPRGSPVPESSLSNAPPMPTPGDGAASEASSSRRSYSPTGGFRPPRQALTSQLGRASESERSRSLVHLEVFPPRLAEHQLRSLPGFSGDEAIGARVGPAGLGPRGDLDLAESELRRLEDEERKEQQRRVVAPRAGRRGGVTSAPDLRSSGGGGIPAVGSTMRLVASAKTWANGDAGASFVMPTPTRMRKSASLASVLVPEPSEALLRAQAIDRRTMRQGAPSLYAPVKLSAPPAHFSSVASVRASPLEFLASMTDWSGGGRSPPTGEQQAVVQQQQAVVQQQQAQQPGGEDGRAADDSRLDSRLSAVQSAGGGGAPAGRRAKRAHAASAAVLAASAAGGASLRAAAGGAAAAGAAAAAGSSVGPPSASPLKKMSQSAATLGGTTAAGAFAPSASAAACTRFTASASAASLASATSAASTPSRHASTQRAPPRESRDWVARQQAIDAEYALSKRLLAASSRGGPKVPFRETPTSVGNFISGRPVPKPPRRSFAETYGVPWLRAES